MTEGHLKQRRPMDEGKRSRTVLTAKNTCLRVVSLHDARAAGLPPKSLMVAPLISNRLFGPTP
jgi:hypothetical protein